MRWQGERTSTNVEDRRGMRVGGGGIAIGGGGLLVILALALLTGQNPLVILEQMQEGQVATQVDEQPASSQVNDTQAQFASTVLASTEDVWTKVLAASNRSYNEPRLVLFSNAVQSACGYGSAAVGPFYCPEDQKLYLDLNFFRELEARFGAPGDFAQAYVIAHEVGHHVQNLLGIATKVRRAQERASQEQANGLSVRMELQADCLAGVWGFHANQTQHMLEPGDVEEGLRAAAAIGDDTLQQRGGGHVQPESWTHGSSMMRARWLRRGLESGEIDSCDTFSASTL
jgi:predicted metalloprotease